MNKTKYVSQIVEQLDANREALQRQFHSGDKINTAVVQDLLDEQSAEEIYSAFPPKEKMVRTRTLREYKYIGVQMNWYNKVVEEIIYAFQDPKVVGTISEITGIRPLYPDATLYAAGISLMAKDNFLNPHVDNSHDGAGKRYRALNLLYYVTPGWQESYGGNLELWDLGVRYPCRTIPAKFNSLVIMATHKESWHSVNRVLYDGQRCCVSNYYFSPHPVDGREGFHVTSFRGRPEEVLKDLLLKADAAIRMGMRKILKRRLVADSHVYKKDSSRRDKS